MLITLNKNIISIDQFKLKCSVGKGGIKKKIKEGDKITPKRTKLKYIIIKKNMGWSNDPRSKNYNRRIHLKTNYKYSYEKLYRKDHSYDLLIPIKYNYKNPIKDRGSAIFLHLTNNYKPTAGCIALKKNDFMVMLNLINNKTKIKIV